MGFQLRFQALVDGTASSSSISVALISSLVCSFIRALLSQTHNRFASTLLIGFLSLEQNSLAISDNDLSILHTAFGCLRRLFAPF